MECLSRREWQFLSGGKMQYHKSLAGDPLSQAQAALEKYLSANQIFYDNWEDYQELRKL